MSYSPPRITVINNPVARAGGSISASNTSSSNYADTGMTVTTPNVTGKTYSVKFYTPVQGIGTDATFLTFRMIIDGVAQDSSTTGSGTPSPAEEKLTDVIMAVDGVGPNEVVKIEWLSNTNTKAVYWTGTWLAEVWEEG